MPVAQPHCQALPSAAMRGGQQVPRTSSVVGTAGGRMAPAGARVHRLGLNWRRAGLSDIHRAARKLASGSFDRRPTSAVVQAIPEGDDKETETVMEVARLMRKLDDAESRLQELERRGDEESWEDELLEGVPPPSSRGRMILDASQVAATSLGVPSPDGMGAPLEADAGPVVGRLRRWRRRLRREDEEAEVWKEYMAAKVMELEAQARKHESETRAAVAKEYAMRAQLEAFAATEREAGWQESRGKLEAVAEAYRTIEAAKSVGDFTTVGFLQKKAAEWAKEAVDVGVGRLATEMERELAEVSNRQAPVADRHRTPSRVVEMAPGLVKADAMPGPAINVSVSLNADAQVRAAAAGAAADAAAAEGEAPSSELPARSVWGPRSSLPPRSAWMPPAERAPVRSVWVPPAERDPTVNAEYEMLSCDLDDRPVAPPPSSNVDYSLLSCDLDSRPKPQMSQQIAVQLEKMKANRRVIQAGVNIAADPATVFAALTDYEGLDTFIPSLTRNVVMERREGGSRLEQFAAQDIAMGATFSARVVLDIAEWTSGLRAGDAEHVLPKSPSPNAPAQDITFTLVESRDMREFTGTWRIQEGPGGPGSCRLSYAVRVQPQMWLPVGLIEGRVSNDIKQNLAAVRCYTEAVWEGVAMEEAAAAAKSKQFLLDESQKGFGRGRDSS